MSLQYYKTIGSPYPGGTMSHKLNNKLSHNQCVLSFIINDNEI